MEDGEGYDDYREFQKSYPTTVMVGKRNDCFLGELQNNSHLGASMGLPFDLINEEARRDIGRGIGRVTEVDCKAIAADQAKVLCVKVDMPLDKPIPCGAPILSLEGDIVWVAFQYKRLLGLCLRYGLLGHEAKVCSGLSVREGEELPYGDRLRAGGRRQK
nr:hypothetical protein CFP56_75037 [Quercus suber]